MHISAKLPAAHVAQLAFLARESDRSFSAELRSAVADRVARTQTDDDPAGQGEVVGSTPRRTASVAKA